MDIDSEIRDILMRCAPANDNSHNSSCSEINDTEKSTGNNWEINVIGNQNVVVSTSVWPTMLALSLISAYFLL